MAEATMNKLNTMGQTPMFKNRRHGQIVSGTFGHEGSGKLYSFWDESGTKRAGDLATPEVTHYKSGKDYKTLFKVRSTHNVNNMQPTQDYLQGKTPSSLGNYIKKPTNLKPIGKTNQKSLPGYYPGWDKDAKAVYDLKTQVRLDDNIPQMQKLSLYNQITKLRK